MTDSRFGQQTLKHPPPHDLQTNRFGTYAETGPFFVPTQLGERRRLVVRITLPAESLRQTEALPPPDSQHIILVV